MHVGFCCELFRDSFRAEFEDYFMGEFIAVSDILESC